MLGLGKTGTVRASGPASSARSQDIYQRYAAALYRQALLTLDDSAVAEHVVCDVIVNECALAAMPPHGEDDKERGALGLVLFGGLGYLRPSRVLRRYVVHRRCRAHRVGRDRAGGPAVDWPLC